MPGRMLGGLLLPHGKPLALRAFPGRRPHCFFSFPNNKREEYICEKHIKALSLPRLFKFLWDRIPVLASFQEFSRRKMTSAGNGTHLSRSGGGEPLFMGRRLSDALFPDRLESGSFKIQSWDKATVDAHGMSLWTSSAVGVPCRHVGGGGALRLVERNKFIGVGFCALLVLDWMGKCQSPKRWNG